MNLLLCGRAVSNVWDNDKDVDDTMEKLSDLVGCDAADMATEKLAEIAKNVCAPKRCLILDAVVAIQQAIHKQHQ